MSDGSVVIVFHITKVQIIHAENVTPKRILVIIFTDVN